MLDRRAFLLSGLAAYGVSARELFAAGPALQNPKFPTSPFTLGVCSGDPAPDGVVLWTRLALDPLNGGGMPRQPIDVQWQVATDDRMSRVVRSGTATASPDWAHSVHVEVTGLEPHRWYWYQFRAGSEMSPIGRTRTFPRAQSDVDRLRFAIASCQHFEVGLFTAYQHMAEEDLDLVMHLGDYIYENPGRDNLVRKHVGGELLTIDDYRNRYAQYRSDPALRAAHASFPVSGRLGRSRGRQQLRRPERRERHAGRAIRACAARRATRRTTSTCRCGARRCRKARCCSSTVPSPTGRSPSISMLDTRQYRTDQPCGDNVQLPCAGRDGSARDVPGSRAGKVADGAPRSIARGLEHPRPADSHGEARSLRRTGAPVLDGQVGRLRAEPQRACCASLATRKPVESRDAGRRRSQQLGQRPSPERRRSAARRLSPASSSARRSRRPATDPRCRR